MRKYRNQPVTVRGLKFDSIAEAARWGELQLLARSGAISDLRRQVVYVLAPAAKFAYSRASPPIRYVADFVYHENGREIVEDRKSAATKKDKSYRLKRHLMMTVHGIEIRETK